MTKCHMKQVHNTRVPKQLTGSQLSQSQVLAWNHRPKNKSKGTKARQSATVDFAPGVQFSGAT